MIIIRSYSADDKKFIYNSWLQSFRRTQENKRRRKSEYFYNQKIVIDAILDNPRTEIVIATIDSDPSLIMGWLAFQRGDPPLVHFCYVKHKYRSKGLANKMLGELKSLPCVYTHIVLGGVMAPKHWSYIPWSANGTTSKQI